MAEDAAGTPIFSDVRSSDTFRLYLRTDDLPATSPAKGVAPQRLAAGMRRFSADIAEVAMQNQLEPELLHALIQVESGYDPGAVSRAGAVGLMQLMPDTARRYGARDRRDPRENLRAGARYLRDLMQRFSGNLTLALAAYNAGEGAVVHHGLQIPAFEETRSYVPAVLRRYHRLKQSASG
ncbi:MAG: lytic transglycosylase domain-containing protein [Rhodocyclaceae bacterium]|nr:MAG: lytic transglycosylase domain-containing protein [Rhodocyclaceae bacterium]